MASKGGLLARFGAFVSGLGWEGVAVILGLVLAVGLGVFWVLVGIGVKNAISSVGEGTQAAIEQTYDRPIWAQIPGFGAIYTWLVDEEAPDSEPDEETN